jgi:hypothetical protein
MDKLQSANAHVYVVDLCASSCANYFFVGVKERTVTDGALLLFHGGYSETTGKRMLAEVEKLRKSGTAPAAVDWEQTRRSVIADVDSTIARQDALYARIGVDRAIVRGFDRFDTGRISEINCDPARNGPREYVFFTVPQLAEMGVRIQMGRPASDPKEVNRKITQMGASFEACGIPDAMFNAFVRKPA